jgi:hypothetical protein
MMTSDRQDLAQQWLDYFGVGFAQELDLGTLSVIKMRIDEGRRPPSRANLPTEAPTTPPGIEF